MRRYLQGTLDYACGIYAVVNALACTHSLELEAARRIFQESLEGLAASPELFKAFCRNETDHYWLVRCLLARAGTRYGFAIELFQPFSDCLLPRSEDEAAFDEPALGLHLPEKEAPPGPPSLDGARQEVMAVWQALSFWLDPPGHRQKRAAIFRFHRFLPPVPMPVVSHWTTGRQLRKDLLLLHDASSEKGAIMEIEQKSLMPSSSHHPQLRIVPESLVLISSQQ